VRTLFFDVDTQIDFLYPAGALYVPGAEKLLPQLERLNRFAAGREIPLISTLDTHVEDDPEFREYGYPAHCVRDTAGWRKPEALLCGQRLIEKNTLNVFDRPDMEEIIREFAPERCVLYGVVTEICVQKAADGLLRLVPRVELVSDAVREIDQQKAADFIEAFVSRGGAVTTVESVCR
jgi:nicotinamidase/pyrazinamidase